MYQQKKKMRSPSRSDRPEFSPDKPYDQKLLDVLVTMTKLEWFSIVNRDDYDKIVETVKRFIDGGWPFEFSDDFKKVRRITNFE